MSVLEVVVNSKVYQVGCDEEEKDYINSMIRDLNNRINDLKKQNPSFYSRLNEERLFLYLLLLMCSEINDLKKQKKQPKDSSNDKLVNNFNEKEISRINSYINSLKKSLGHLDSLIKQ